MDTLVDIVDHVLKPLWVVMAMAAFLGILFWAYRPKNKARFEADGEIPLKDDWHAPPPPSNSMPGTPAKER